MAETQTASYASFSAICHAVRIAFVFAVGYAISLLPFAKNGYWILLTSLFVCQISYFATKSRLKLRTLGTILGGAFGYSGFIFLFRVLKDNWC